VQHLSDLHPKFALRSHLWKWNYGRHPVCNGLRLGEEKKEIKKEETTGQKYNGLPYSIGQP